MVPAIPVDTRMDVPMESPEPTKAEKKKATERHIKQKCYQTTKAKTGLRRIEDLQGEIKSLIDNKNNLSLLKATAHARTEKLKATANQLAETLTLRVH